MNDSAREMAEHLKAFALVEVARQMTDSSGHRLANSLLRGYAGYAFRASWPVLDLGQRPPDAP